MNYVTLCVSLLILHCDDEFRVGIVISRNVILSITVRGEVV